MKTLTDSHGFNQISLAFAGIACLWWILIPNPGLWPLILASIPWVLRLVSGKSPFHRTSFDFPIAVFLITAGSGVWAAYDRGAAWNKFGLIATAIIVFYALANQPADNRRLAVGMVAALAAVEAGTFLLTYDWQTYPVDLDFINRAGRLIMAVRPSISLPSNDHNMIGGISAAILPLSIAFEAQAWKQRSRWGIIFGLFMILLLAMGLLMSSSKAAWASLVVAVSIYGWRLASQSLSSRTKINREILFVLPILLIGLIGLGVLFSSEQLPALFGYLHPDQAVPESRAELFWNTWHLIGDFPFTGGGLTSFSGLYSRYVLVIPYLQYTYSHNLYLDVALEQGVLGLASFLLILLSSVWILIQESKNNALIKIPVLIGLLIMVFHGIFDDAFYGMRGSPLLFALSGLTIPYQPEPSSSSSPNRSKRNGQLVITGMVLAAITAMFALRGSILAKGYANLGAIKMAQVHLAGWPDKRVEADELLPQIEPAKADFEQALIHRPKEVTALYRLGMIALEQRQFEQARQYLARAFEENPGHRGIRKELGYSYLWLGDIDKAATFLIPDPETRKELSSYQYWWKEQGRDDLSLQAALAEEQIFTTER